MAFNTRCFFQYPKAKLEPSPFVEVRLGQESHKTPVKIKTVNPLFQCKFIFFVRHPEGQELTIEAFFTSFSYLFCFRLFYLEFNEKHS